MDDKKLKMYQEFGSKLIEEGKEFLRKATPMNKVIYPKMRIGGTVQYFTGVFPVLNDEKYHTTDINTWKTIIKNDWTNKKKYVSDTFDCDNFSNSFCAYCADIYELNTAGRFTVALLDKKGKHVSFHRAVIIIDSKLECYLLESQNDKIVKLVKGRLPVIDGLQYKVNYISLS